MLCAHTLSLHGADVRSLQPTPTGQYREERALAGPVDPEEPEALAPGDAERGGLDGYLGPEAGRIHLAHALDLGQSQCRG